MRLSVVYTHTGKCGYKSPMCRGNAGGGGMRITDNQYGYIGVLEPSLVALWLKCYICVVIYTVIPEMLAHH